jgi:ABC-type spermidine/putrescine transport system permease subunit II
MELSGKIIAVLPAREGVSKSGNPWKTQEYVLETHDQYPRKMCFNLFGADNNLSFVTILISHVTFCLPYVILSILPKFRQMDPHLSEAAMDLGCTPFQTFWKVEFPSILPGIVAGALMAFTLSLDDFVISYFTSGSDFQTLPILIYSMTKKRVTPDMYALSTIMFVVILILLLLNNYVQARSERIRNGERKIRKSRRFFSRKAKDEEVA